MQVTSGSDLNGFMEELTRRDTKNIGALFQIRFTADNVDPAQIRDFAHRQGPQREEGMDLILHSPASTHVEFKNWDSYSSSSKPYKKMIEQCKIRILPNWFV
jgi:hypothetical protein